MSDFESDLAKTPMRGNPPEWRGEILHAARAAVAETAAPPWWRWWVTPQRFTLGTAWLIIVVLRFATPAEPMATPSPNIAQIQAQIRAQQKLLAELLQPAAPAPARVDQQGATVSRRKHLPV
jgi:hypothetical protein